MRVALIIPVYNHGASLPEVIRQAQSLHLPMYVVDDGSTDGTAELLAALEGIIVLRHPVNRGKGAALLTGFAAAAATSDWALTIDADGQHCPADAVELLETARKQQKRVIVIGNRQGMHQEHVPWTSRFGRGFSNFWVWAAGGPYLADSQSGFRLYPLPEALHFAVKAQRYQFEVEVLVRARRQGIESIEVPVSVVYQPKGVRVSHFRPWVDFCRNSATFSQLIWARIFGRGPWQ